MVDRSSSEPLSGDIMPPTATGRPLVVMPGAPHIHPISVHGAELRIVEAGRIHRWNPDRKGFDLIGLEAAWIAQRLVDLDREANELRKAIGQPDIAALVNTRLLETVDQANSEIETLRQRVQLVERERDDFKAQLVERAK